MAAVSTYISRFTTSLLVRTISIGATITHEVQSLHFDARAERNEGTPDNYVDAMSVEGADNTISANCHQFTAGEKPNIKVCWPDGKEAIYNSDNIKVTDSRDVGTYNYYVPNSVFGIIGHSVKDVLPWIIFGNYDDDTSFMYQRVILLFGGSINNEK